MDRYANDELERLKALAADLVGLPAAVIIPSRGRRPPPVQTPDGWQEPDGCGTVS
jgi:hypothetical protein